MTDLTRTGAVMNPAIRNRIVELLTDPAFDGMTQAAIAAEAKISDRTLRNYLTPALWTEVRQIRLEVLHKALSMVDRALFHKATQGDIQAAKLIYERWDSMRNILPPDHDLHSLNALDTAIEDLEQRINDLEHTASPETPEAEVSA